MQITSPRNPFFQEIRRATSSGRPTKDGLVVAEGPHLLDEAMRGTWTIEQVIATSEARIVHSKLLSRLQAEVVEVSERVFASAAGTETSQGVLGLLRPQTWTWDDLTRGSTLLVILDAIQDPGNAGAIVRSAEAFGATGIVLIKGSVHRANGKFLRATAGSAFRMPILENIAALEVLNSIRFEQLTVFALSARGGMEISRANLTGKFALIVGNESAGVSSELLSTAVTLRIPTARVESLNAAVACSICLFEAARQRNAK